MATAIKQLPVGWIRLDHGVPVRHEEVLEQEQFLILVEIRGRFDRHGQKLVGSIIPHIVTDLFEERGNEVEGLMNVGEVGQERGHVIIVLDAMHPDPRKDVGASHVITIVRLVHVPDKSYMEGFVAHGNGATVRSEMLFGE